MAVGLSQTLAEQQAAEDLLRRLAEEQAFNQSQLPSEVELLEQQRREQEALALNLSAGGGLTQQTVSQLGLQDFVNTTPGSNMLTPFVGQPITEVPDPLAPRDDLSGRSESSLSDFFGDLTGSNAADAANIASQMQIDFSQEALDILRQDLDPFRTLLSGEQLQGVSNLATSPEAQASFLDTNPLFQDMSSQIREDVFNQQSAAGALGSSGTDEILASQLLQTGNALIDQQLNRSLPLIQTAQGSAAQQAGGEIDLLTGIGNALAGGQIGQANANAAGQQNIISAISALFGANN